MCSPDIYLSLFPGRPRAGLSGDTAVMEAQALPSRGFRGRKEDGEAGISHVASHM